MQTQLTTAAVYAPLLDFAGVCPIEDSAHVTEPYIAGKQFRYQRDLICRYVE